MSATAVLTVCFRAAPLTLMGRNDPFADTPGVGQKPALSAGIQVSQEQTDTGFLLPTGGSAAMCREIGPDLKINGALSSRPLGHDNTLPLTRNGHRFCGSPLQGESL